MIQPSKSSDSTITNTSTDLQLEYKVKDGSETDVVQLFWHNIPIGEAHVTTSLFHNP